MARQRSAFGSIVRRRAGDGKVVAPNYRGKLRPGYYVRVAVGGREVWRKAGNTLDEARAFLGKIERGLFEKAVLGVEAIEDKRFEDFAEEYLAAAANTLSPTTLASDAGKVRNLLVPWFRGRLVSSISRKDIEKLIEDRGAQVSIATRNRDLALLSAIFKKAIALGYTRENPVKGFGRPAEAARSIPYVMPEAQRLLVDVCPSSMKPLVLLALDTGLRQGELLRLEWSDVDLARRVLCVRTSKNKRPREVPLTARACELLTHLHKQRGPIPMEGADRVLSWMPTKWGGNATKRFQVATRAAGLPHLRFHDLRHLFGSNCAQAGVPIPDIAKLMGHKTLTMALRYASHAPTDSGSRAIGLLEAHLRRGEAASEK